MPSAASASMEVPWCWSAPLDIPVKVMLPQPIMTDSALSVLASAKQHKVPVGLHGGSGILDHHPLQESLSPQFCQAHTHAGNRNPAIQPHRGKTQARSGQKRPKNHLLKEDSKTVVVRNLPNCCTQESLLLDWPAKTNGYDILYMPSNSGNEQCSNFAFINFTTREAAQAFKNGWHGRQLKNTVDEKSKRVLNVAIANVQGRDAILALFKKRRVGRMQSQNQPMVFKSGTAVQLGTALAESNPVALAAVAPPSPPALPPTMATPLPLPSLLLLPLLSPLPPTKDKEAHLETLDNGAHNPTADPFLKQMHLGCDQYISYEAGNPTCAPTRFVHGIVYSL